MRGIQNIRMKNRDASFNLTLNRNITIIRGDSGTGKTTLYRMVETYMRLGEESGIQVKTEKALVALSDTDWKHQLSNITDSIVFVEENAACLQESSQIEFAKAVRDSDNYYVLFSRRNLYVVPYSVDEIYTIKTSGKIHTLARMYKNKKHVYSNANAAQDLFSELVTEDTNSGLEFFQQYFRNTAVECISAGSNSAVFGTIKKEHDKVILVIADGAAFGAEMNRVMELIKQYPEQIILCLPECFEWLILKSGLIDRINPDIPAILEAPSDYIESKDYLTWEQYFEHLLVSSTAQTPEKADYQKSKMNPYYLTDSGMDRITSEIVETLKKHI